tara:strand:- start:4011 stop:5750 length:1740 start_codon:yes stop_codon:yes gene_type:complete
MSCIGSDKNNPSCTFSFEAKADSLGTYNEKTKLNNGTVDGYHLIEGQYVKPVIDSDMNSPTFLEVIEIRTLNSGEYPGGIVPKNSKLYKDLQGSTEYIELKDRTDMGVKYYAEKNGQLTDALAAADSVGNKNFAHVDTTKYENAVNNIGSGAFQPLYKVDEDGIHRGTQYGNSTGKSDVSHSDAFDGGSSNQTQENRNEENLNGGAVVEEEIEDEIAPPVDTENSLEGLFKLAPVLKYPSDGAYGAGGQDYIRIETFKYKAPMPGAFGEKGNENSVASVIGRGPMRGSNLGEYGNTIKLPIPNDLRVSNGVEWGGAKANALEMAAMTSMTNTIGNTMNNGMVNTIMKSFGSMGKIINQLGDLEVADGGSGQALTAFVSKLALSKLNINVDTNQFVARSSGIAINPNLELLFSSPKLRSFTFRFDFAPNDEVDARNSRLIMRIFKQGMLPTGYGSKDGTSSVFIGSPHVYRIGYFNGTNRIRGLPIHKICALTQCSINFTPENVYQSYSDDRAVSNPVRSVMELAFTELTPLFAEDYNMHYLDEVEGEIKNNSLLDLARDSGEGGILQGSNEMTKYDIGF